MAAGAVIWVIGVVLLGCSALLLPAFLDRRRRGPARPPAGRPRRSPPNGTRSSSTTRA